MLLLPFRRKHLHSSSVQQEEIPRVPVVCTGNDFSTLYAPLIRDGRMEKFYWAPTREDRIGVATGIFQVPQTPPLCCTWHFSQASRTRNFVWHA